MALLTPTNATVSIYTGSSAATPYTLGALRSTVKGYLRPAVANGRFGSASWLKWTHLLFLPPGTEIHDAYNTQLDPSRDNTKGDTVILLDSGGTKKTAFYVAFVELVARGSSANHLRAYLDRFAPQTWPTDAL